MYIVRAVTYYHYGADENVHGAKNFSDAIDWIEENYPDAKQVDDDGRKWRDEETDSDIDIHYLNVSPDLE